MTATRFRLGELRAEWAELQREPVDQFWMGPAPFVERLFGIIEEQQHAVGSLRAVLAPFLSINPRYGALQVLAAEKVWEATEPWSAARPS